MILAPLQQAEARARDEGQRKARSEPRTQPCGRCAQACGRQCSVLGMLPVVEVGGGAVIMQASIRLKMPVWGCAGPWQPHRRAAHKAGSATAGKFDCRQGHRLCCYTRSSPACASPAHHGHNVVESAALDCLLLRGEGLAVQAHCRGRAHEQGKPTASIGSRCLKTAAGKAANHSSQRQRSTPSSAASPVCKSKKTYAAACGAACTMQPTRRVTAATLTARASCLAARSKQKAMVQAGPFWLYTRLRR